MPGLLGVIRTGGDDAAAAFEAVLAPMHRGGRLQKEQRISENGVWAMGRVHLGVLNPAPQLDSKDSVVVLFHGDLQNLEAVGRELGSDTPTYDAGNPAALLAALYRRFGSGFADRLEGAFCAAVLDTNAGRLVLINDLLGSYPVYWFLGPAFFTFAGELKSVLRAPDIATRLDPDAVGDFIQFGFPFGTTTLAADVKILPSGSTLVFDWRAGDVRVNRYARIRDRITPWQGSQRTYLEALRDAFNAAVATATTGNHHYALALSGGLDSRAILSAVDALRLPLSTYTLGVKGCADEFIAERLARIAGSSHCFFELDRDYLGEFLEYLRRMVWLTDGMYLSHGLTEMLAFSHIERTDYAVLLRGHGGELAKMSLAWPLHTDQIIHQMSDCDALISYLLTRFGSLSGISQVEALFTEDWGEWVRRRPRQALRQSLEGLDLSPAEACAHLYLEEHHRRFTISSLELFRNLVEVRMPFCHPRFLRTLFSGEPKWHDDTTFHKYVTRANNRALARVRNSNTGAPGDAPRPVEFVLDKFNSLFKRLNVHGYRHYHNFGAWMNSLLVDSVEAVLLDDRFLDRGIVRESALRRLIAETRNGVADHGYLLQALLILELWQQQALDR